MRRLFGAPYRRSSGMSFEARCPQCLFVTRQLGQPTPCLLHVVLPEAENDAAATTCSPVADASDDQYDEPYEFGRLHVSVDRPGPFTLREYTRLQLLRGKFGEPSPVDRPIQDPSPAHR